jgi:hypothetical protein
VQERIQQAVALRSVTIRVSGQPAILLVDPHRDVEAALQVTGEADVIEVTVGEEEGSDVGDAATERGQAVLDGTPGGGVAGVDQSDGAAVLDHVAVGDSMFDEVDVVGDHPHLCSHDPSPHSLPSLAQSSGGRDT